MHNRMDDWFSQEPFSRRDLAAHMRADEDEDLAGEFWDDEDEDFELLLTFTKRPRQIRHRLRVSGDKLVVNVQLVFDAPDHEAHFDFDDEF